MGREIRKVPEGWEHPRFSAEDSPSEKAIGSYRPQFQETREQRAASDPEDGQGDEGDYRSEDQAGGDWHQLYENTTEGTPRSEPFATLEELLDHLATQGDNDGRVYPEQAIQILRSYGSLATSEAWAYGV